MTCLTLNGTGRSGYRRRNRYVKVEMRPESYSRVTQAIHWITAVLIFALIPLGMVMTRLPEDTDPTALYRVHVSLGLIILLLTLVRVVWRVVDPNPQPAPLAMPPWRRVIFKAVNVGLYGGLVLVVVTGLAMLIGSGMVPVPPEVVPDQIDDIPPRTAHRVLAWVFAIVVVSHLAGVISYQMTKGDTLGRMLPRKAR